MQRHGMRRLCKDFDWLIKDSHTPNQQRREYPTQKVYHLVNKKNDKPVKHLLTIRSDVR